MNESVNKTAILSTDKKYRYVLTRIFNEKLPIVAFVGLNPSTADDKEDDPTINKCISYCKNLNYGGFYMVNLFAYRSTDQSQLFLQEEPVGVENDKHLANVISKVDKVICCWGNTGTLKGRNVEVLKKISQPYCLNINISGEPTHPLYQKWDLKPILFNADTIAISASQGKLKKQFLDQLKEIGQELNISVNKHKLVPNNWQNHSICFSYEEGGILYGINRNKRDKNKSRFINIEQAFKEEFQVSEWWPMYRYFYNDINSKPDFWTDIKDGKIKELAKVFIETIVSKFDTNLY